MSLPGAQAGGPNVVGSPNVLSEPLLGDRVIGAPATGAPEGAGVLGRVDEVAARATAGPAGELTPGFVGGRGGRRDADKERKRPSYLENPDPDETFGTDQIVAPPVIGA
jgi:hypothetical protein